MRGPAGRRLTTAAVLLLLAGCGGKSDPPTAPAGFFPQTFTGAFVVSAPMIKSAAVGPQTTHFVFHVSVPKGQEWAVVVRCDTGRVTVDEPGGDTGGPCTGKAEFFPNGQCGAFHATLKVSVSQPQRGRWGSALFAQASSAGTCR